MKKQFIFITIVMSLFLIPLIAQDQNELRGISFFSPRSQSTNAARELAGWHPYINLFGKDRCYGSLTITPGYYHSVRASRIADVLFNTDVLHISGSQVTDRNPNDILADYFGLSPEFVSTVNLEPIIQNGIITFNGYLGLDSWCKGLYIRFHAPFVWTKWDLNLCEEVFDDGSDAPFPALYMAEDEVSPPVLKFTDAISGGVTFGQMQDPLQFGKINKAQTKTGFSDVEFALGWNFVLKERGFVGLNLRAAAPTGSRPEGEFLFEPIVGNGKHWEFGMGLNGKALIWEADGTQELSLFIDVNITHLFGAKQKRSFDLKDDTDDCPSKLSRFGSRYILVKEFDSSENYVEKLHPAINITTLDCKVSALIQLDIVFMFGYTYNGFVFDLGYNGWIRSKENIELLGCIPENTYGLKGIQDVETVINTPDILTQSTATLEGNSFDDQDMLFDNPSPIFLQTSDLQPRSAAQPLSMTHKLFTYFGYGWNNHYINNRSIEPFVGLGAEVEFEGINERDTAQPNKNTLSQWGIWLKAGISC